MNLLDGNHCCCTTMSETSQIKNASCPGWRRKCNTYSKWFAAHRISHLYKLSEEKMRVLLVDSMHHAPSMNLYWFGWLYCRNIKWAGDVLSKYNSRVCLRTGGLYLDTTSTAHFILTLWNALNRHIVISHIAQVMSNSSYISPYKLVCFWKSRGFKSKTRLYGEI